MLRWAMLHGDGLLLHAHCGKLTHIFRFAFFHFMCISVLA